jgi:hypothetical protein
MLRVQLNSELVEREAYMNVCVCVCVCARPRYLQWREIYRLFNSVPLRTLVVVESIFFFKYYPYIYTKESVTLV